MTTDNNTNDETVPDEMMIECHLTGQMYPESEMQHVWRNNNALWQLQRRNNWMARNTDPDAVCPITMDRYDRVYIHEDVPTHYCSSCGDIYDTDDDEVNNEIEVCGECAQEYSYCYEHDHYYREYCESCEDENDEYDNGYGSSLIHDYGYRPSPTFFVMVKNSRDLSFREPNKMSVTGFELEMECNRGSIHDAAQLATDLFGETTYLKHDGSLSNGFEMVSHPMSLDYINGEFNFADIRKLADIGMRSAQTSTCGLHIHINKSYFRGIATSAYRFMSMFYSNPEKWRAIAGRSESSYARWDISEMSNLLKYTKSIKGDGAGYHDVNYDRYVAVNLQPSRTIELRFFKGTLRPETLHARLQAIHAVAEFSVATRNQINIKQSSDWDNFREWTTDNESKYGVFNAYATSKGV